MGVRPHQSRGPGALPFLIRPEVTLSSPPPLTSKNPGAPRLRRRAALLAVLALAGCGGTGPNSGLESGKAQWEALGITSYEYVVTRGCFCESLGPVRVVVTDGVVTSRTMTGGQPVPAASANNYPDVPGLFALVEDAFRRAASTNATFDAQYGFPAQVVIDYIAAAVDDELTVTATGFIER